MKPSLSRFALYKIAMPLLFASFLASCQSASVTPEPQQLAPVTQVPSATPALQSCLRGPLAEADEIVLGAIYPLSSVTMMRTGFAMQAATTMAVSAINKGGGINGKPVRLVVYDSGSSPAQGALYAERLATLDCAAAIVGVYHSDVAMAVKEVAIKYHIPVVFADPYADEVTMDLAPEVFRIAPTRTMLAQSMGQWFSEVGDYNGDGELLSVLLVENSHYGALRIELAQQWLPSFDIRLKAISIDLPTTDFSPVIARIVALDILPDAIFIYLHNGDSFALHRQLLDAGIGPQSSTLLVTTATALDSENFWSSVPDGEYTVISQIGPWHTTVTETGKQFAALYQQYFDRWPQATAFEAYDAVWLVADALRRAKSINADDIIHALETTDLELASGHYTFPYGSTNLPDGEKVPSYMWHQWPQPQILYLQYTEPGQSSTTASVIWPPHYRTTEGPLAPGLSPTRLATYKKR